jgi:hypothetical protein
MPLILISKLSVLSEIHHALVHIKLVCIFIVDISHDVQFRFSFYELESIHIQRCIIQNSNFSYINDIFCLQIRMHFK